KSGAEDEYYVQKAMIHYEHEIGVPFRYHHCWDVLKDSLKFQEITFPNFNQGSEGSSKRHKSFGSSSFNTESGDASINLNTTVADEDEMQEIRRPCGRDKARVAAKNKGSKASRSSTMNDDALARLMVNEMTAAEIEQRDAFMELKRREVECREREIEATKYRAQQEDIK
ncbi:reverse transcriptase domain-containing protein, partial [Tanacetum coccineum]